MSSCDRSCPPNERLESLPCRPRTPLNRDCWVAEALNVFWKEFNFVEECVLPKINTASEGGCCSGSCGCDFTQLTKFLQQIQEQQCITKQIMEQLSQRQGQPLCQPQTQSPCQQCCGENNNAKFGGGGGCGGCGGAVMQAQMPMPQSSGNPSGQKPQCGCGCGHGKQQNVANSGGYSKQNQGPVGYDRANAPGPDAEMEGGYAGDEDKPWALRDIGEVQEDLGDEDGTEPGPPPPQGQGHGQGQQGYGNSPTQNSNPTFGGGGCGGHVMQPQPQMQQSLAHPCPCHQNSYPMAQQNVANSGGCFHHHGPVSAQQNVAYGRAEGANSFDAPWVLDVGGVQGNLGYGGAAQPAGGHPCQHGHGGPAANNNVQYGTCGAQSQMPPTYADPCYQNPQSQNVANCGESYQNPQPQNVANCGESYQNPQPQNVANCGGSYQTPQQPQNVANCGESYQTPQQPQNVANCGESYQTPTSWDPCTSPLPNWNFKVQESCLSQCQETCSSPHGSACRCAGCTCENCPYMDKQDVGGESCSVGVGGETVGEDSENVGGAQSGGAGGCGIPSGGGGSGAVGGGIKSDKFESGIADEEGNPWVLRDIGEVEENVDTESGAQSSGEGSGGTQADGNCGSQSGGAQGVPTKMPAQCRCAQLRQQQLQSQPAKVDGLGQSQIGFDGADPEPSTKTSEMVEDQEWMLRDKGEVGQKDLQEQQGPPTKVEVGGQDGDAGGGEQKSTLKNESSKYQASDTDGQKFVSRDGGETGGSVGPSDAEAEKFWL